MKLGIYVCFCVALCGRSDAADETYLGDAPTKVSVSKRKKARARSEMPAKPIRPDRFTNGEDAALVCAVADYGQQWDIVAGCVGRSADACRTRWRRLDPDWTPRLPEWTENEDLTLCMQRQRIGPRWTEIAKFLPRHTDNNCKNRYLQLLDKAKAHNMEVCEYVGLPPSDDVDFLSRAAAKSRAADAAGVDCNRLAADQAQQFSGFYPIVVSPGVSSGGPSGMPSRDPSVTSFNRDGHAPSRTHCRMHARPVCVPPIRPLGDLPDILLADESGASSSESSEGIEESTSATYSSCTDTE
jgi:hypothetical protein